MARRIAALFIVGALVPLPAFAAGSGDSAYVSGRFTVIADPSAATLARALLAAASRNDTFPGLPRPRDAVRIEIARDRDTFHQLIGPSVPEWGAAFAFPAERRIVMQGRWAPSDAGDPIEVLRHELAHLALHEYLGDLAPRWFDEGYASFAAGEWARDQVIATNVALALKGMPSLTTLDSGFYMGAQRADASYALAYRAVAELAEIDSTRGLSLFFSYWKASGSFEIALRQAFGLTTFAFEKQWRDHTRRRYGGIAFFADATIAALVFLFLVTPFYVLRRRRDRLRMDALRRADEEQDRRDRETVLEALLHSGRDVPSAGSAPPENTS